MRTTSPDDSFFESEDFGLSELKVDEEDESDSDESGPGLLLLAVVGVVEARSLEVDRHGVEYALDRSRRRP